MLPWQPVPAPPRFLPLRTGGFVEAVWWEEDGRGKECMKGSRERGSGGEGKGRDGEGRAGRGEGGEGREKGSGRKEERGGRIQQREGREKECVMETERLRREILMMILIKAYRNTALFPCCSGIQ